MGCGFRIPYPCSFNKIDELEFQSRKNIFVHFGLSLIEKIETSCAFLHEEGGIVHLVFKNDSDVEEGDVREITAARYQLRKSNEPQLVIADIRGIAFLTNDAKKHAAQPEVITITKALAVVISSTPTRMMANFFIKFQRPDHPTKLFLSVDKAKIWLKSLDS